MSTTLFTVLAVLWLVFAGAFIMWRWTLGRGVGLVVSLVLGLSAIHWVAAVLYLLPWYENLDRNLVATGYRIAFHGLCAFCIGVLLASRKQPEPTTKTHAPYALGWTYLVIGVVMYAVLWPRMGRMASVGALVAAGSNYIVAGICLECWNANGKRLARWLLLSATLPFVTILTQGYLSYGLAALAAIAAFIAEMVKSRRRLVLAGVVLGYVMMSFFVTYMRDRAEIRDRVWGGAETSARIDVVRTSFTDFEWFDPRDPEHLWRIDDRLNQDYFVGLAAERLQNGVAPYAMGETIKEAATALLPRILWPDKAVTAGSGDIVSRYTGMMFREGTSVGVGLIMELYVNFGIAGVWIGLAAFGALLVLIDERAYACLANSDFRNFALWYLPGTTLLQLSGGSLVDASLSAAAVIASISIVNAALRFFAGDRRPYIEGRAALRAAPAVRTTLR
jgi:hypothetical protein